MEDTRKRVGRLYREGFFQNDDVAKAWSLEYPEEVKENREEEEPKKKKKKAKE